MGNTTSNERKKLRRQSQSKRSSLNRPRFNSISTLNSTHSCPHERNILGRLKQSLEKPSSIDIDSQLTLLNHSPPKNQPLAGILYDNQSVHSTSTTMKDVPSSEYVLQELLMSSETSPERRRDRDRRHRQHYLLKRIWKSNYRIPLHNPTLIVNWCCATAVWDIELAFEFPNANIIGIDYESVTVSSLTNTVKNFTFQNANVHIGEHGLNQLKDNSVDYIMMRDVWLVNSTKEKWYAVFQQVKRILKRGGYIEIYQQDLKYNSIGPSTTLLEQWSTTFLDLIHYDTSILSQLDTYLDDIGFVHINKDSIELPVGEWADTNELKETGFLQRDLTERRYRESKRWLCSANHVSEKEYTHILLSAMDECDSYKTTTNHLYFVAQKP